MTCGLLRSAHNVEHAPLKRGSDDGVRLRRHGTKRPSASKRAFAKGVVRGPSRARFAGRPITTTGGHCWFMGSEADGPEGVRQGGSPAHQGGRGLPQGDGDGRKHAWVGSVSPGLLQPKSSRLIAEEGHRRGLLAAAHCRSNEAMRMVIDARFDVIMHGWFADQSGNREFDDRLADLMAEREVRINPTLHITRSRLPLLQERVDQGVATDEESGAPEAYAEPAMARPCSTQVG